jgi:predicted RNA-binding Zn-ribbon protein involved in translation (DUF1610 family)
MPGTGISRASTGLTLVLDSTAEDLVVEAYMLRKDITVMYMPPGHIFQLHATPYGGPVCTSCLIFSSVSSQLSHYLCSLPYCGIDMHSSIWRTEACIVNATDLQ